MPLRTRVLTLSLLGLILLWTTSCSNGPTYPKAHVAESLQQVLLSDQLHATVKLLDHTLAVELAYPHALAQTDSQLTFGPAFDEAGRKIITAIRRVLLSSDADVRFYVLLLSDPTVPGAYLTMVQYMDDVRRSHANMLPDTEMFFRTLFDFSLVPSNSPPLTVDQYVPRDIQLEEFLSWQLARRIQRRLIEEFQLAGVANVGRCSGEFRNGEFAFALNMAPASNRPLDDATLRKVFQSSTTVIANVLSNYHFSSFDSVRLIYLPTGRNFVLPKDRLSLFR